VDEQYKYYEDELLNSFGIFDLTPIQWAYYIDNIHTDIICSAGRRSRKTLIGKRKMLEWSGKSRGENNILAAPTFSQAKSVFWNDLKETVRFFDIQRNIDNSELIIELINGTTLQVGGLDRAYRFEGVARNNIYVTEAPNVKYEAWEENIMPMLADTQGRLIRDGTPDFRNPKYQKDALYNSGGFIPKNLLSTGAFAENENDKDCCYYSWLSADVLKDEVLKKFRRRMDPLTYLQEFEAAFIESQGRVYYTFTNDNIIKMDFDPSRPVLQCWDVNYSDAPMATILVQEFYPKEIWGDFIPEYVVAHETVFVAVKEFANPNTNTAPQCEIIEQFYRKNNFMNSGKIQEYGDRVGHDRRTGAPYSHYAFTKKYFGSMFLSDTRTRRTLTLPDRLTSLNGLICNIDGKRRFFVNHYIDNEGFPTGCPELVADLQQVVYAANGYDLESKDIKRTHTSDAVSYWSYYEYEVNFNEIITTLI